MQAIGCHIEPHEVLRDQSGRVAEDGPSCDGVQTDARALETMAQGAGQAFGVGCEQRVHLFRGRRDRLGRRRRRGSAVVGYHVGDRRVGFVPDARDHGNGRRGHRACERLVVERHEVLEATASAHEQDDIASFQRTGRKRAHHAFGRRLAFDRHACDRHRCKGEPASQRAQDVAHRIASRRGDDAHLFGKSRNGTLARIIHEAFGAKRTCERVDLLTEVSLPRDFERRCFEAHASLGSVDIELTGDFDLHADAKPRGPFIDAVPHHARQRRLLIFDGEVHGAVAQDDQGEARKVSVHAGDGFGDPERLAALACRHVLCVSIRHGAPSCRERKGACTGTE